ncbi:MAG: HlyD family efflux transporter periplasmic adaptor subunit, partial [Deltaproteobacteria bacterium]|nr:HlyD family efflux transporter periplasmic adaptor subunit [Deltaproteobacteria bacterium]
MKRKVLILLLVLAAAGAVGYYLLLRTKAAPSGELRLAGHIEATETNLGFKVPGAIAAIHFQEGQEVQAGQVVAELESGDLRQEVAVAAGRLAAARANLTRLENGFRPEEVREAQAAAAQARADYVDRERDYRRMENLFRRKVVSASTRDKAEAAYLMSREALRRAQETYDLRRRGYRREDIEAGRADVQAAMAQLELARTRLGYATITTPVAGVVLARPAEPGQVVQVGATVLTLGDLDNVWFEGWIPET